MLGHGLILNAVFRSKKFPSLSFAIVTAYNAYITSMIIYNVIVYTTV